MENLRKLPQLPIEIVRIILHLARCNASGNKEYVDLLLICQDPTLNVSLELDYISSRSNGYLPGGVPHGRHQDETKCHSTITRSYYAGYRHGVEEIRLLPITTRCGNVCPCIVYPNRDITPATIKLTYDMGILKLTKRVDLSGYYNIWNYSDGSTREEYCNNKRIMSSYTPNGDIAYVRNKYFALPFDCIEYCLPNGYVEVAYAEEDIKTVNECIGDSSTTYYFFNDGYEINYRDETTMTLLSIIGDTTVVNITAHNGVKHTIIREDVSSYETMLYTIVGTITTNSTTRTLNITNASLDIVGVDGQRSDAIIISGHDETILHHVRFVYQPSFFTIWT